MRGLHIYVAQSPTIKGMGVFASEPIKKGDIIEVCPLILVPMKDFEHIKKTKLYYYFFEYTKQFFAVALGYCSLYNHSFEPNAQYDFDYRKKTITVKAMRAIAKDEEIFFNYNWDPKDKSPLGDWFKAA